MLTLHTILNIHTILKEWAFKKPPNPFGLFSGRDCSSIIFVTNCCHKKLKIFKNVKYVFSNSSSNQIRRSILFRSYWFQKNERSIVIAALLFSSGFSCKVTKKRSVEAIFYSWKKLKKRLIALQITIEASTMLKIPAAFHNECVYLFSWKNLVRYPSYSFLHPFSFLLSPLFGVFITMKAFNEFFTIA